MRSLPLLLLTILVVAGPSFAVAGDEPCKSTQAANELRTCGYCREIKRVLSDPGMEAVGFEVTPLELGATVRMTAGSDEGRLLLQDLAKVMWGEVGIDSGEHVCDYCRKRRHKLEDVIVDWTATGDGVQLVLISKDHALAQWALTDARKTQDWVLGASGD